MCLGCRLIISTSNMNLSRIKSYRKTVWFFHLTLWSHLQKLFIVFLVWKYIIRQHFSKTYYMSKPHRNYWPITHKNMFQKSVTMIIRKECNSNTEANDNLFYTPLNWKKMVNKWLKVIVHWLEILLHSGLRFQYYPTICLSWHSLLFSSLPPHKWWNNTLI